MTFDVSPDRFNAKGRLCSRPQAWTCYVYSDTGLILRCVKGWNTKRQAVAAARAFIASREG